MCDSIVWPMRVFKWIDLSLSVFLLYIILDLILWWANGLFKAQNPPSNKLKSFWNCKCTLLLILTIFPVGNACMHADFSFHWNTEPNIHAQFHYLWLWHSFQLELVVHMYVCISVDKYVLVSLHYIMLHTYLIVTFIN